MVFNVGAALQLIPRRGLGPWYAGRVVSGVGVGFATVIIPMYSAEMAPKSIRGSLGSMFQFFFTLGVMTSYWIDYAVSEHMPASTQQWQVPVGLQLVPGGLLALGMLYPKESARWLARKGRVDDALASLAWVRGGDTPEVQQEYVSVRLRAFARTITNGFQDVGDLSEHRGREASDQRLDLERVSPACQPEKCCSGHLVADR